MKKSFTLLAAMAATIGAMAQIESANIDPEALGLGSDPVAMAAGTVLCQSENVVMSLAFDENGKASGIEFNDCKGGYVNGQYFPGNGGITGSANPKTCTFTTAPTEGWVMRFDTKKAGYIVCFSKLSSNKNYWVYEGLFGTEENAVAYNVGIIWDGGEGLKAYNIDLPATDMGYVDLEAADATKYYNLETQVTKQLRWIITGDEATELSGNGFGYIAFPVYPDVPYLMCAQGSKMSINGFVFVPSDNDEDASGAKPTSIAAGTEEEVLYTFYGEGGNGINGVAVDNVDVDAPVYNVMGQRVSKNAKGLLIQNGRKFYNF